MKKVNLMEFVGKEGSQNPQTPAAASSGLQERKMTLQEKINQRKMQIKKGSSMERLGAPHEINDHSSLVEAT